MTTNTTVKLEFDEMRLLGVTNHIARIAIPSDPVRDDNDFALLMNRIQAGPAQAVDVAKSCHPDQLILGMSAESFWDGAERLLGKPMIAVNTATHRCALRQYGVVERITSFGALLAHH